MHDMFNEEAVMCVIYVVYKDVL